MRNPYRVLVVLGIRPDFIRASVLLRKMVKDPRIKLDFVYTGQHYDDNLMGVFFRELNIPHPTFILDATGETHVQQHARLLTQLEEAIKLSKPDVCVFLGDANAVIGCIAPLKMGIPIAHIEAGMRSYDWTMPEERNRVIVDRVSDVLYCYQEDYKYRLIREGINPEKIVVTGNTIVDVMQEFKGQILVRRNAILQKFAVQRKEYGIMTLHRDGTMNNEAIAKYILKSVNSWASSRGMPIVLVVMPRLKKILDKMESQHLSNFIMTEPLGMFDFMALEREAAIEFTDSGTNQETSTLFGTPCVVTRHATERPETFDSGICVMEMTAIPAAADFVIGKTVKPGYSLGDGRAAETIIEDLIGRLESKFFAYGDVDPFVAKNSRTFCKGGGRDIKRGCWF